MSLKDAYKPNLKRAAKLFGAASGVAGISTNEIVGGVKKVVAKGKQIYKGLEDRAKAKEEASPYVWKRVGGSQPIRVRKPGR